MRQKTITITVTLIFVLYLLSYFIFSRVTAKYYESVELWTFNKVFLQIEVKRSNGGEKKISHFEKSKLEEILAFIYIPLIKLDKYFLSYRYGFSDEESTLILIFEGRWDIEDQQ